MIAQIIAEFEALGAWCVIHGPEIWVAIVCASIFSAGIVIGMFLAALLSANREDDK